VRKAEAICIGLDELEAVRLADLEGLYQDAAAERMAVSRQTYARILGRARHAIAACLVGRKMLMVEAGPVFEEAPHREACPVHGGPRRMGRTCHCPAKGTRGGKDCPHPGPSCPCHGGTALDTRPDTR
jgi:predicted DNA-binding protein (UPF0251 family)